MKRSEMRGVTGGETVEEGVEGPAWPEDMVGQVTERRSSGRPSTRFGQVIANTTQPYICALDTYIITYSDTRIVGMLPGNKIASSLGDQG